MSKKVVFIGAAAVVVVVVASLLAFSRPQTGVSDSLRFAQAAKLKSTAKCTTKDNKSLPISAAERASLELVVIGHIIDVPAGTNVDVLFNHYDGQTASGSSLYEKNYGTYNFTVAKQSRSPSNSTPDGDWQITAYTRCQV
jgi:hypothetical protein